MEILCDSVEETKRFAFDLAMKVKKGTVISLNSLHDSKVAWKLSTVGGVSV